MNDDPMSAEMKKLIEKHPANFTGEILRSLTVLTPKQEVEEREADMRRLKALEEAAAPLVKWIREYYNPYTAVLVSWDSVSVEHEGDQIPFPYSEK